MMVQLAELAGNLASKTAEKKAGWVGKQLDAGILTKAVIFQAFSNLAVKLKENSSTIAHYDSQPALTSLIALLTREASGSLSQAKLKAIESKHEYEKEMQTIRKLNNQYYYSEYFDYANELVIEYLESGDNTIKNQLLENLSVDEKNEYLKHLESLEICAKELKEAFNDTASSIFRYIFPEGHKDPALSKFLGGETLFNTIFQAIETNIGSAFFAEYNAIRGYSTETEERKADVEQAVGTKIDTVVQVPAKLIGGVATHVLQFSPAVLGAISTNLLEAAYEKIENPSENEKKEAAYQELGIKNLSDWILKSVQKIAKTDDKELQGILDYGNHFMITLAENILGKSVDKTSQSQKKGTDQFFNSMATNIKEAANSDKMADKLKYFVQDLPLPANLKKTMISKISESAEKGMSFSALAKQAEKLHTESKQKLESYEGGNLLFAIIENMANQLTDKMTRQSGGFITGGDPNAAIQDLLDELLPGITLDSDLKNSFKANFEAFQKAQFSKESTDLLNRGIEAVLMQAILHTIAEDFDPKISVKDQFLARFNQIFKKSFSSLTPEEKKDVRNALEIQTKIDAAVAKRKSIEKALATQKQPLNLSPLLQEAFDKALTAKNRIRNAFLAEKKLHNSLNEKLLLINKANRKWTLETLEELKRETEKPGAKIDEIPLLANFSSKTLKQVSSALDIYKTIEHAKDEYETRIGEAKKTFADFQVLSKEEGFEDANNWLEARFNHLLNLDEESQHIAELELAQKQYLAFFEKLSKDAANALGLGSKDKINLPGFLLDKIWPSVEEAKTKQGAKILFDLTAPIWLAVADKEIYKEKILENEKNKAVVRLVESATRRVLKEIPVLVSKPETAKSFAVSLNTFLPGILKMEGNIIKEMQSLVAGEKNLLSSNQEFLQNYIEGIIFKYFALVGEGEDILTAITNSLNDLLKESSESNQLPGFLTQKSIDLAIDTILSKQLKIASENDLENIPAPLRSTVYNKLKESLKEALIPLLLSSVENEALSDGLVEISGSPFLSDLSKALSDDVFYFLPSLIQNLDHAATELFKYLANDAEPTAEQLKALASQLAELKKEGKVSNTALAEAFATAVGYPLSDENLNVLKKELQKNPDIKANVASILMTPEEISAKITQALSSEGSKVPEDLKPLLENEITIFVSTGKISYIAKALIQNQLLKFFHAFAVQNLSSSNTGDSFFIFIDKFLKTASEKISRDKPIDEIAKDLESLLLEPNNLGIFEGLQQLPKYLREPVLKMISGKIESTLVAFTKPLALNEQLQTTKKDATRTLTNQVAQYIGDLTVAKLPAILTQKTDNEELVLANTVSSGVERQLESLASTNSQLAMTLLNYVQTKDLKTPTGRVLESAANAKEEDKAKAAVLIGNLLAEPLNAAVTATINFENRYQEKLDEKLASNLLHVLAGHLEIIGKAEKEGSLTHDSFIKAAGDDLHRAVPVKDLDFSKAIDAIKEKLNDLEISFDEAKIRAGLFELSLNEQVKGVSITYEKIAEKLIPILDPNEKFKETIETRLKSFGPQEKSLKMIILDEINSNNLQRKKEFYNPVAKDLLYVLFPGGKTSLTFVPPALRNETWRLIKKTLLPLALPIITETVLSPEFINNTVLNILKSVEITLAKGPDLKTDSGKDKEKVKKEPKEMEPREITELDRAAAHFTEQLLTRLELPSIVKNKILDENGKVRPEMMLTIGDALKNMFNGKFIQEKLMSSLENTITGKKESKEQVTANMDDIKKAARAVANSGISYLIDMKWNEAQRKWDESIEVIFGKVGGIIKKIFDAVFRFIFFTLIGNVLRFVFRPVVRASIHSFLSINKNMEALLAPFNKMPDGQSPLTKHVIYNEDLVYKLVDGLRDGIQEILDAPQEEILA
ncbi:MAG TPA: hypothetical protein PLC42_05705 [Parachlamydiaceae bacterium]|nr:hypothetical protein [Parachlamydiaceae bacterium]